jgi:Ca-activated chloride channel family protein
MIALAFLAPARLVLLVLPIVLAVAYLVVQARRRRYALRFTTLDLLDEVAPDRPGWRRHLPAAVLLAGTVAATLAVARPAVAREFSEPQRIVVLAVDTSLSMQATDIAPSRLDAAKAAVTDFLDTVPDGVAVGVVAFDAEARQLIQPTTNLDAVRRVIEPADLGEGTAIGEAVFLALDAIETASTQLGTDESQPSDSSPAGTIVLLSDGETTHGRPNDEAAAEAKAQGIAVNTVAFGTDSGTIEDPLTGAQVPVPVNEAALGDLARTTGGESLQAETADELANVYQDLGRNLQVDVERREVTDWFAGASLLLLVLAATGSLFWFGRLP